MRKPLCLTSLLLVAASGLLSPLVHSKPLTEALAECRQQQNALKRLVCYDEISVASAAKNPAKPTHAAVQVDSQSPAQLVNTANPTPATKAAGADNDFGLEHIKKATKGQSDQLYLTVSSIRYSPRKELIVEFDNGQIWRQSDSGDYKIAVGEHHFIKRGMLNSFTLGNDDNNRSIKVRRVK